MEARADTSKILMSDVLKGRLPQEVEDEVADVALHNAVTCVALVSFGGKETAIVGILRSILFEAEPEVEFRVQLSEALDVISTKSVSFRGFELHHGERVVEVPGPFEVKGARIDDISTAEGMCTLSLGLKRPARAT